MKRRSSRKVRTSKRRTRKQRGGEQEILFLVVLFSEGKISSEISSSLTQLLATVFNSEIGKHEQDFEYKLLFEGDTGLQRTPLVEKSFEESFLVKTPPAYLKKDVDPDRLLTTLEHHIGNALLTQPELNISLLPAPHGVSSISSGQKIFMVGLCNPACERSYRKNQYRHLIHNLE